MWKGLGISVGFMLCLVSVQPAVLRSQELTEATTEYEEVSTTVEPDVNTTPALSRVALSRDTEATVQIGLVDVDPASSHDTDKLKADLAKTTMKSAKLLLLSTPAKRPIDLEQQFEEQDEKESTDAGSGEVSASTTTTKQNNVQEPDEERTTIATTTTTDSSNDDHKTTKLFAINATTSTQDTPVPNVAIALATDNATVSIAEEPQAVSDNNVGIELALVEPEAEYVLVDGDLELTSLETHDELQLGSFTHIDSDVHLQPVVHSVEIVPTRFDDPLIVNYVHNFR